MCPQYDIQFRYHHPYLQDCFPNFVKAFANDSLTRIGCIEPKPVTGRCCFVAKLSSENPIKTFSCSIQLLHYCTIEHPVAPIDVMMVSFQFDQNTYFSKDDSHTRLPDIYIYVLWYLVLSSFLLPKTGINEEEVFSRESESVNDLPEENEKVKVSIISQKNEKAKVLKISKEHTSKCEKVKIHPSFTISGKLAEKLSRINIVFCC